MGLLHLVEHVQQSQAESMSWLRGHKTGLALAQWARCLAQQNQTRAENQLLGFLWQTTPASTACWSTSLCGRRASLWCAAAD